MLLKLSYCEGVVISNERGIFKTILVRVKQIFCARLISNLLIVIRFLDLYDIGQYIEVTFARLSELEYSLHSGPVLLTWLHHIILQVRFRVNLYS